MQTTTNNLHCCHVHRTRYETKEFYLIWNTKLCLQWSVLAITSFSICRATESVLLKNPLTEESSHRVSFNEGSSHRVSFNEGSSHWVRCYEFPQQSSSNKVTAYLVMMETQEKGRKSQINYLILTSVYDSCSFYQCYKYTNRKRIWLSTAQWKHNWS